MKINFKQIVVCILFTCISSFAFAQEKVPKETIDKIKSYLSQTNLEKKKKKKNDRPAPIVVTKDSDRYIDPNTLGLNLTTNNNQKTIYRKNPIEAVLITGENLKKIKNKVLSKQSGQ